MDYIIKLSRNLCVLSIALVLFLVTALGFWHYIKQPTIFIPPPVSERQSLETVIAESNNLETLKNECAKFARCEDNFSRYQSAYPDHIDNLLIRLLGVFIVLGGSLAYGFFAILQKARKLNDTKSPAL